MASNFYLSRGQEWSDRSFWRVFAPSLHVYEESFMSSIEMFDIDDEGAEALQTLINIEGYFHLPPVEWRLPLDEMVAVIRRLDAEGIPVPFAFIYDEFWALYVKLYHVIQSLLGPGYFRLPDFWVWCVDPQRDDKGWAPHRDKNRSTIREDGSPQSVTVWIPLTESTPLNGCIYMVPADRDPTYNTDKQNEWQFDYQDIRALPALPGSILAWNQQVLHWGARGSQRETNPRISVAVEFQAADIPPFRQPLSAPNSIPDFGLRLALIAKQILQYQHMYPLEPEVRKIAEDILAAQ